MSKEKYDRTEPPSFVAYKEGRVLAVGDNEVYIRRIARANEGKFFLNEKVGPVDSESLIADYTGRKDMLELRNQIRKEHGRPLLKRSPIATRGPAAKVPTVKTPEAAKAIGGYVKAPSGKYVMPLTKREAKELEQLNEDDKRGALVDNTLVARFEELKAKYTLAEGMVDDE